MSDGNDFNERNIAEFRANHGRVGGPFEGAPIVLQRMTSRTIPVVALTPTGGAKPRE